jgi:hypothetical protein
MNAVTAYCGLMCETCPIHLATLESNISRKAEMRLMIAEELSKIYGSTPKSEIITDCDGCKVRDGRLFTGCADCEIRKCAILKEVVNCAYCCDYPCENLKKHFVFDPGAQARLEEIHKKSIPLL